MDSYRESKYKQSAWITALIAPLLVFTSVLFSTPASAYETSGKASFDITELVEVSTVLDNRTDIELLDVDGGIGFIKYGEELAVITVNNETPVLDEYAADVAVRLQWTVSFPDRIEIGWYGINDRYTDFYVYRNDELIGQVKDGISFIDNKPLPGAGADYRVETSSLIPESEWAELLTEEELEATIEGKLDKPTRGHIYGYPTLTPPENNYKSIEEYFVVQAAAAGATSTQIRYSAFITDTWVHRDGWIEIGCPVLVQPLPPFGENTYFKGDARSWFPSVASTLNSRVQLVVKKDWTTAANPSVVDYRAGKTDVYWKSPINGTMNYWTSKQANPVGGALTTTHSSASSAVFKMKIEAKNPWCPTGDVYPIKGSLNISITQNGFYTITGSRRPVPNHEAYIKWSNGSVKTIFQKVNQSFSCLNSYTPCSDQTISVTGSGY